MKYNIYYYMKILQKKRKEQKGEKKKVPFQET